MNRAFFGSALATLLFAGQAPAQPYPSRPVTFIVPYGAGGPVDTLARLLSEPMRTSLGQPVIVENVDRRERHDRRCSRRTRRSRRLYREHRQLALARGQWRDLYAALRHPHGFRTCRAAAK